MGGRWTGRSLRKPLLGALVLAPLLLGGCASGDATPTAVPTTAGEPWILVTAGNAPSSAVPKSATGTPSTYPTGFLPLASTSPTPAPTGSPSCVPKAHGTINYADAVPATNSAAVTWYNPGGLDLVEYRVTAISQNLQKGEQRDVGWTVITPGATCGFMSATVTGLDSATYYVFSVDAVRTRRDNDGTIAETIARSIPIRTK
ncbi:MAG TPA: fibronectin type III domain-containing protein [Actinoplanes sp.]